MQKNLPNQCHMGANNELKNHGMDAFYSCLEKERLKTFISFKRR